MVLFTGRDPDGAQAVRKRHQSYREAVRREPDNRTYREGALNAALAMKKARPLGAKIADWVRGKK